MSTSRRAVSTKGGFAALKAARQGQSRSKQWKDDEDIDLYDEVDEAQYKSIVKGRLQRDDFVIDDDGAGYADNGLEGWDDDGRHGLQIDEDSDHDRNHKNKSSKQSKSTKGARLEASAPTPDVSAYRRVHAPEKEADFMSNIFSAMDAVKPKAKTTKSAPSRRNKRKSSPVHYTSSDHDLNSHIVSGSNAWRGGMDKSDASSDAEALPISSPTRAHNPKRVKFNGEVDPKVIKDVSRLKVEGADDAELSFDAADFDDCDFQDFMEVDEVKSVVKDPPVAEKLTYARSSAIAAPSREDGTGAPAWLDMYSKLATKTQDEDTDLVAASTTASLIPGAFADENILEKDGSLHFFWLDYLEEGGKLFLIGKVLDRSSLSHSKGRGMIKYISCLLKLEGIERNLFILPRDKRIEDGFVTDMTPEKEDVEADFDTMRRQVKIKSYASKWVKRKYTFGFNGAAADIPDGEFEWLKVSYSFKDPQFPSGDSPNIAHILGTNTSAFELFVLKRKIMGPCWIRVQQPEVKHEGISWCKVEVSVSDPKLVNPFSDTDDTAPRDMPPLTVMSLSMRSVVNHQLNTREVIAVSTRVWENNKIDDTSPPEQLPSVSHTVVRPLGKYPNGFEAKARAQKNKIIPATSERALMGTLLAQIHRHDPDIIIGHEFISTHLEIILQRARELKTEHWSRLGRVRRAKPPHVTKYGNMKFLAGRLVCDLSSDGAKGMIASTTWSLTEMCATQLKVTREDIDLDDTPMYLDGTVSSPEPMLRFVQHCEMDAFFQMAIAWKVQILPLTRQLTNLAGNSWHRTLTGARAERNEYILLHEFHRLKYICPDKYWTKQDSIAKAKAEAEEFEDEDGTERTVKGKNTKSKDKYKGGLVFKPKRGLWDKYILVMDFNSLYPSIIQEFNIDFTTVDKLSDEDGIPDTPDTQLSQGVLPRLIATLVNRRRQVKSLMKDRTATPAKLMQWDIKQQALKLTANSMYGCLGFTQSRFYARPLAALTTFKGRQILTHTRELAESMNLDVVYGDTDSVFVNSNATDLAEALKTANQFKKLVNERYRLLEIDLDGVFQRLLLLQKKKYAALKVDEGGKTSIEIKGLDMKRREFCALSKTVSEFTLNHLLSGEMTEVAVENIHEYLTKVGQEVREGKIPLEEYIINKRLGKNPEDFPDVKSQPHAQVALRLKAKGRSPRAGDVMQYIFCLGENGESSKSGQADRAFHPDEIRRSNGTLKIDYDYYLSAQVLPSVDRLCDSIEGTDRARLAECLGLNATEYTKIVSIPQRSLGVLDSLVPDFERFRDTTPFIIHCHACAADTAFSRLSETDTPILTTVGPRCPSCHKALPPASLELQLELHIREHIGKFYEGWTICDDPTCGMRTRRTGVHARKCLRLGCQGNVSFEYTDAMLYNQLLMHASLFDISKALNAADQHSKKDELHEIIDSNQALMRQLHGVVDRYLNKCGRRWVDLADIFSFARLAM
ncbi:DNA polymerase alpha catalytic subunit [Cantharellus anzutake]|uniref:DNA polymerase alpha catalytic subunit n=1 Tax=Cantharellus anzutake TaxID=1750568 RepID=UPI001908B9BC|nr:DNA polymerase alpha catalytic subunit [Cantharellus anzutake]KAF8323497.1 DNA polymerase alpha catalytic subunit [Cantharellus anzutake]